MLYNKKVLYWWGKPYKKIIFEWTVTFNHSATFVRKPIYPRVLKLGKPTNANGMSFMRVNQNNTAQPLLKLLNMFIYYPLIFMSDAQLFIYFMILGKMHNPNHFVRDFYFFKRSQYPQLTLAHKKPTGEYQLQQSTIITPSKLYIDIIPFDYLNN